MGLAAVTDSVAAIDPAADPEWDRFVEGGGGRFAHAYHLAAWRAVHRRAYGRDPIYLRPATATATSWADSHSWSNEERCADGGFAEARNEHGRVFGSRELGGTRGADRC